MSLSGNQSSRKKATSRVAFFFWVVRRALPAFFALFLLAQSVLAGDWTVRVEAVLDGDTLILEGGERLRLRGIDAPEVAHEGRTGQYYGQESGRELSRLVAGRDIFLDRGELGRDRYGRLVGVARLGDGRVVNLAMIEHGAAFVYPHDSDKDTALNRRLLAAQAQAMARGEGFWPEVLRSSSAGREYAGTRGSRRFHTMSCSLGRQVKAANQVHFSSLRDAFSAGYAPARECTPWPPERGR